MFDDPVQLQHTHTHTRTHTHCIRVCFRLCLELCCASPAARMSSHITTIPLRVGYIANGRLLRASTTHPRHVAIKDVFELVLIQSSDLARGVQAMSACTSPHATESSALTPLCAARCSHLQMARMHGRRYRRWTQRSESFHGSYTGHGDCFRGKVCLQR